MRIRLVAWPPASARYPRFQSASACRAGYFGVAYCSVVRARLAATTADGVTGEARSSQGQHGVGGRLGDSGNITGPKTNRTFWVRKRETNMARDRRAPWIATWAE
jgi:hypothetical protein